MNAVAPCASARHPLIRYPGIHYPPDHLVAMVNIDSTITLWDVAKVKRET